MKIILVNPSQQHIYGKLKPPVQMHMGLAYIAAILKKNHYDVSIVDMDADGLSEEKFCKRLKHEKPDVVAITVTTPTLSSSLKVARAVKKTLSNAYVIFGGMHPSIMPKEVIAYQDVDFVIKGEGEETFIELLSVLIKHNRLELVKGILFKRGGKIIENASRELIEDLDKLPFPARGLFKNTSYTYPDSFYAETAPMITSRGCPGRCTYCNAQSIFGRSFRARSAKNVVDEIELLQNDFKIREIHIWDDNFVTKKQRVFEIRDEIKRRDIKVKFAFPNGIRADFLNKEVLSCLKDMGTYSIAIGVESGSQKVLDMAKKGIKLSRIIEAFSIAKEIKLETWAFFMFGLPGEDLQTAQQTIEFAKRLDPDIAKFHILKPYPGTEAYRYIMDNGFLISDDYDDYGIHTPPIHYLNDLSQKDLSDIQKRAYREFYFRPKKILKQLLRVRSYNRLKLNVSTAIDLCKMVLSSEDL
jgi:radical SAM superfamily enzyme YgiQ (UPF0313 family)